jgi:hypothetical protein
MNILHQTTAYAASIQTVSGLHSDILSNSLPSSINIHIIIMNTTTTTTTTTTYVLQNCQSQYFTTGGLPPISSSWPQGL